MRCRKVRSFLSAYCNDELTPNRIDAVADHLDNCADCRREETLYRSILDASRKVSTKKTSADFNNKLMNRIAQERFKETRTKAYLPKRAPLFSWSKVVPAVAAVCLVLFVSAVTYNNYSSSSISQPLAVNTNNDDGDDSYLTVMPTNNPNLKNNVATVDKNWSFNRQLAQAERINKISNVLTSSASSDFYNSPFEFRTSNNQIVEIPLPFVKSYFIIRPVIKVYVSPDNTNGKEDARGF
ncbi:MAG: zf-HC2 domain-containing protein [candidate division Zixibacteria bacterium]|nr:zf-HC2 domain-containing protein [candidate division Zixibacteria bacterium]